MRRSCRSIAAMMVFTISAMGSVAFAPAAHAAAGDGSVTVKVVREVNGNGAWDQVLEPGMAGVTVTLTDDAGTSISGVTVADGTVTLAPAGSALVGGKYRVQVINPKPGVLFSAFADRTGLTGAPNKLSSTEEFVDVSGSKNISYTTAFWNPGDYCQKNATLVTACVRNDSTDQATRRVAKNPDGSYLLPARSHVRIAHPRLDGGARMLRRGYSYDDGPHDKGLIFLAYMRDPALFTRVQRRLAGLDDLSRFIEHRASAIFFVLPGAQPGRPLGASLHPTRPPAW